MGHSPRLGNSGHNIALKGHGEGGLAYLGLQIMQYFKEKISEKIENFPEEKNFTKKIFPPCQQTTTIFEEQNI